MSVLDDLLKPCTPIGGYYREWAKKLKAELDALEEVPQECQWLYMLLSFCTSNAVCEGIGEGRFSPQFQIDDQVFPHPSMFPPESLCWIRDYASRAENVAIHARAFDFLWEHDPKRKYKDALRACDAYLEMAKLFGNDDDTWIATVDALDRAMTLACQINDKSRAMACRDVAVEHLRDCCAGARWAEVRDGATCLLAVRQSKFKDLLEPQILSDIAGWIDQAATTHQGEEDHHGEMRFLDLLVVVRRAQADVQGERAVLMRRALSLHAHAEREAAKDNWMVASSFYADAVAAYQQASDAVVADQMKMRATEANARAVEQMASTEATVRIPREAVEQYIGLFSEAPDLATALIRLSLDPEWLLDVDLAAQRATDTEQASPFYSMVSKQILRDDRVAATASSSEERRRYLEMQAHSRKMRIVLQLRHEALRRLRQRGLCAGDVIAHLEGWPLMPATKLPFFRKAVYAYFDGDYIVAVHLLVPHLEDLLRRVLRVGDIPSRGFGSDGAQTEQVLGDVLRNPKVVAVIGEALQRTLIFVLTDEQGFNLRNLVAHGLFTEEQCTIGAVEVLLWLLLSLTVLRRTSTTAPSESDVASAAYRRWRARGEGHGRDREDWFAAIYDLASVQDLGEHSEQ
jgi:hypothetical protein